MEGITSTWRQPITKLKAYLSNLIFSQVTSEAVAREGFRKNSLNTKIVRNRLYSFLEKNTYFPFFLTTALQIVPNFSQQGSLPSYE